MANEKRLIDANAFIKECDSFIVNPPFAHPATPWHRGILLAAETALRMPKVDAVEVVRCKDCIHYVQMPGSVVDYRCSIFCGCYERPYPMEADGFCSYGERREGE